MADVSALSHTPEPFAGMYGFSDDDIIAKQVALPANDSALISPYEFPTSPHGGILLPVTSCSQLSNVKSRPGPLSFSGVPPFDHSVISRRSTPSPTRSPNRLHAPPLGHKRSGSEFVGGGICQGGPVLVSATSMARDLDPRRPVSPVKPSFLSVGTRRGHAHRRSAAVSQGDVKRIMQPSSDKKSGSAPSTPMEASFHISRPEATRVNSQPQTQSVPTPKIDMTSRTIPSTSSNISSQTSSTSSPERLRPRVSRVGFSESLEFIPRPLSTISSDTSSSISTIKPTHTASDSVTSIVSSGSPRNPRSCGPAEGSVLRGSTTPLSTCDDIAVEDDLNSASTPKRGAVESHDAPSSEPSGFDDVFNFLPRVPFCRSSPHLSPKTVQLAPSSESLSTLSSEYQRPLSSRSSISEVTGPCTKSDTGVRQRIVNDWANCLYRRPTNTTHESGQDLSIESTASADFHLEDVTFDDDTTFIIEQPSNLLANSSLGYQAQDSHRLVKKNSFANDGASSPMIDLNDALGPAGRPGRSLGLASGRRFMHSSGETGGFSGPGMHYHRRTESAPSMEAFDRSGLGMARLGSNTAIGDVIVEEEEDYDHHKPLRRGPTMSGLGVEFGSLAASHNSGQLSRSWNESSSHDRPSVLARKKIPRIVTTAAERSFGEQSLATGSQSSVFGCPDSLIIPPRISDATRPRPASAPIDVSSISTCSPFFAHSSEAASSFDSHAHGSPYLNNTHTAHSSITDRMTLSSIRAGETCASCSTDDVPSLISSASTVFSGLPPRISSCATRSSSAERPVSAADPYSNHLSGRPLSPSKRSSLASLSRLVANSYNRSKLNIAETHSSDDISSQPPKKKPHRISRMMRFWKSKEKLLS